MLSCVVRSSLARCTLVRSVSTDEVSTIIKRAEDLHRGTLAPLNAQWQGPLEKNHDQITKLPFVFLLGNHSSGKSTFINYVAGRDVQTTGVAPTDDSFTIIAPGEEDADQDGPSLVGEPDMGFAGLRMFGPSLIHHTQLKVRAGLSTTQFMLVDSPGMIDSPAMATSAADRIAERGYDFEAVTRWCVRGTARRGAARPGLHGLCVLSRISLFRYRSPCCAFALPLLRAPYCFESPTHRIASHRIASHRIASQTTHEKVRGACGRYPALL